MPVVTFIPWHFLFPEACEYLEYNVYMFRTWYLTWDTSRSVFKSVLNLLNWPIYHSSLYFFRIVKKNDKWKDIRNICYSNPLDFFFLRRNVSVQYEIRAALKKNLTVDCYILWFCLSRRPWEGRDRIVYMLFAFSKSLTTVQASLQCGNPGTNWTN